jgi:hypothetical protein
MSGYSSNHLSSEKAGGRTDAAMHRIVVDVDWDYR